ncbi:MAG TPA: hypothetical protein VF740_09570 [Candidatus Acidoferrum sp.]
MAGMIERVRTYFKHGFLLIPGHATRGTKERSSLGPEVAAMFHPWVKHGCGSNVTLRP